MSLYKLVGVHKIYNFCELFRKLYKMRTRKKIMVNIEFFKEIKIDKNPEIIKNIIDLYWEIFINKNKKHKDLVFVKRSEIVCNSKYSRRNCYKHLKHLLLRNIFIDKNFPI